MARHYKRGLAGLKEDAMDVGVIGASALAGLAAAKFVTDKTVEMAGETLGASAKWVAPLIPVAVGVGFQMLGNKQSGRAAEALKGAAAGMVAYGIGKLVVAALPEGNAVAAALPLAGVDVYDSAMAGLGAYGAGMRSMNINRYMRLGGAPVQVQRLAGAPVQVQRLNGSPTQVQMLAGAPLAATLTA
jgi:hypothetical protein